MVLDRACARPLYLQLEDLLRARIENGELKPGDRVPSELELARAYGINRMTARRALDTLVMEGILFRRPGKGTFVAPAKVVYAPATLFSFSTAMRALGLSVSTRILDLRLVPASEQVAHDLQLPAQQEVVLLKRLRCVENLPMAIHTAYMPGAYFASILDKDLACRPINEVMEEVSGFRITASRDYIEASLARADEAALLEIPKGAPVLLVRGIVYTRDGLPVRTTKAVYRGDHFRFFATGGSEMTMEMRSPGQMLAIADLGNQWLRLNFFRREESRLDQNNFKEEHTT